MTVKLMWGDQEVEVKHIVVDLSEPSGDSSVATTWDGEWIETTQSFTLKPTFWKLYWLANQMQAQNPRKAKRLIAVANANNPLRELFPEVYKK